jgi:hypothetical protein
MRAMWGKDVSWDFIQVVSLWFLGVFKLFLWFLILISAAAMRRAVGRGKSTAQVKSDFSPG